MPDTSRTTLSEQEQVRIDWLFMYHSPTPEQIPRYEKIRAAAKVFATELLLQTDPGADQEAMMRLLRETVMTANASVALEGRK